MQTSKIDIPPYSNIHSVAYRTEKRAYPYKGAAHHNEMHHRAPSGVKSVLGRAHIKYRPVQVVSIPLDKSLPQAESIRHSHHITPCQNYVKLGAHVKNKHVQI